MNFPFRIRKKHYTYFFFGIVFILFLVRLIFPSITHPVISLTANTEETKKEKAVVDSITHHGLFTDSLLKAPHRLHSDLTLSGKGNKHKIYSVSDYAKCFPDINDIQLATAKRLGVAPVADRNAAEHCKDSLVYIGNSPYYFVKKLYNSIPYLVPRAQLLLTKIGRNFLDSQLVKHVRPSLIMVTSITRTKKDVADLRRFNGNASENSCHCHGTTFDISYNKYHAVQDPDQPPVYQTRNDTLKFILSEVLNDLRKQGLCYVKYEVKQGCYHITVR